MKTKFLGMATLALALLLGHRAEAAKANSYPALPGGLQTGDQLYVVRNGVDYTDSYTVPSLGSATGTLGFANGGTGLTSLGSAGQCLQVTQDGTALTYGSCGTSGGSYTAGTGLSLSSGAFSVVYGIGASTAAQGNDSRITGAAQTSNNLSDLASPSAARSNLGLGSLATASTIPAPSTSTLGGLLALASSTAHQVVAYIDNSGVQHLVQLAASDISGLGSLATQSTASLTSQVTGILPVTNGGTGTASPGLVAGTNVTVTGSWPNQTIASTASGGNPTVTAKTANFSVPAATSPTYFSNQGAAGPVAYSLPSASSGLSYCFMAEAVQSIIVIAAGSNTLRNGSSVSAAGGNFTSNGAAGDILCVTAINSSEWFAVPEIVGAWTVN